MNQMGRKTWHRMLSDRGQIMINLTKKTQTRHVGRQGVWCMLLKSQYGDAAERMRSPALGLSGWSSTGPFGI